LKTLALKLVASTKIYTPMDDTQLLHLQYIFVELDRILQIRSQLQMSLTIQCEEESDGYRVMHYLDAMTDLRSTHFELKIMVGNSTEPLNVIRPDSYSHLKIMPLISVGALVLDGVIPYRKIIAQHSSIQKQEESDSNSVSIADKPARDALTWLTRYTENLHTKILSKNEWKGTHQHNLSSEEKEEIIEKLAKEMDKGMGKMGLLSRTFWLISLWAMVQNKSILHLALKENMVWDLNMEAVHCTKMDATCYCEGVLQILENACSHTAMKRAYLSVRIREIGKNAEDLETQIKQLRNRRTLLESFPVFQKETSKTPYALDEEATYSMTIMVINDASAHVESSTPPQYKVEGIADHFSKKSGHPLLAPSLEEVFGYRSDKPEEIAEHYGLRLFEKNVCTNKGFFRVVSPSQQRDQQQKREELSSYRVAKKGKMISIQESVYTDRAPEDHCTYYQMLLPLTLHWNSRQAPPPPFSHRSRNYFLSNVLEYQSPVRVVIHSELYHRLKEAKNPTTIDLSNLFSIELTKPYLYQKSGGENKGIYTVQNKMEIVTLLHQALTTCLKPTCATYLLDWTGLDDFLSVELLAKMLFLFLATQKRMATPKIVFLSVYYSGINPWYGNLCAFFRFFMIN
ncbi:MAG: hypothetical protein R3Y07_04535, partial [Eubacteriales bacterium]